MVRPLARPTAVITAVALLVLPLLGVAFKVASPGWLLVVGLFGPFEIMLLGYGLQIAIAVSGFLARRAVFVSTGAHRAVAAAWLSAIGVLVAGFFVVDFGDVEPGYSLFTQLVTPPSADFAYVAGSFDLVDLSSLIAAVAAVLWIAAWVWLVVEWFVAIRASRRAARAAWVGPAT